MGAVLANFLYLLLWALQLLLIVRVIASFLVPRGGGGFIAVVYQLTEPVLAPIRRILPATAGIDFSPLVAMILLSVLLRVIGRL